MPEYRSNKTTHHPKRANEMPALSPSKPKAFRLWRAVTPWTQSPLRTSSHATLFIRSLFSLQTPVERSERVAGCWAVRARANPLSLGVWHFTLRFVFNSIQCLELGWLPQLKAERLWHAVSYWTQSLPKTPDIQALTNLFSTCSVLYCLSSSVSY